MINVCSLLAPASSYLDLRPARGRAAHYYCANYGHCPQAPQAPILGLRIAALNLRLPDSLVERLASEIQGLSS